MHTTLSLTVTHPHYSSFLLTINTYYFLHIFYFLPFSLSYKLQFDVWFSLALTFSLLLYATFNAYIYIHVLFSYEISFSEILEFLKFRFIKKQIWCYDNNSNKFVIYGWRITFFNDQRIPLIFEPGAWCNKETIDLLIDQSPEEVNALLFCNW